MMTTENQIADNESFEMSLAPEPVKRKRSSILKQPDKRSRDSRTVSFNDKYFYKELYQDGTCDMDITMMDVIDPIDHTIDTSIDMSMDQTTFGSQRADNAPTTPNHDNTLEERDMISMNPTEVSREISVSRLSHLSEISSMDDTLFGAFHDSNNLSNRSSGVETLMHNIEALNDCLSKVDHDTEECRRRLDAEINDLFKFYRHVVNKDDPYEFAIAIFGLRHSLWLIIKVNPETYPFEKLKLRFAVSKRDRHLYPFKEYAEAVRRYTKAGSYGYVKRFVISAQKFRRFWKNYHFRSINHTE